MRTLLAILPVLFLLSLADCTQPPLPPPPIVGGSQEDLDNFQSFKAKYHRRYASPADESTHFEVFSRNMKKAKEWQARNPEATFGAGPMADLTDAEFRGRYLNPALKNSRAKRELRRLMETQSDSEKGCHHFKGVVVMSDDEKKKASGGAIDWREKGAVTPVQHQGYCGSCYAFSAAGNIEGQWFLAGNDLTAVSPQQLVSCDGLNEDWGPSGCGGGLEETSFKYLLKQHDGAISTAESYPYTTMGEDFPVCDLQGRTVGAKISGYVFVQNTEDDMAAWILENGPLSVHVDAAAWEWYEGGILTDCVADGYNSHAVLIVGYDDTDDTPYWIIKNSWGEDWGENGYIRIAKGSNTCYLTSDYPLSATVGDKPINHPCIPSALSPAPVDPSNTNTNQNGARALKKRIGVSCMVDWSTRKEYSSLPTAEKACADSKTCNGIMDDGCRGERFYLCYSDAIQRMDLEGMGYCNDWTAEGSHACIFEPVAKSSCTTWSPEGYPTPAPPSPAPVAEDPFDLLPDQPHDESAAASVSDMMPVDDWNSTTSDVSSMEESIAAEEVDPTASDDLDVPLPPVPPPMNTSTFNDTVVTNATADNATVVMVNGTSANITNGTSANTTDSTYITTTNGTGVNIPNSTMITNSTANNTSAHNTTVVLVNGTSANSTNTTNTTVAEPAVVTSDAYNSGERTLNGGRQTAAPGVPATTPIPPLLLGPLDWYTSGAQRSHGGYAITTIATIVVALFQLHL